MLYAITDSQLLPDDRLAEAVAAALRGGCRRIQYRDKSLSADVRLQQAQALLALCLEHDAELIINDDPQLAARTGAHGVHLGEGDMPPGQARRLLGPKAIIGITCHDSLDLAHAAAEDGASYIAFGRFFPSSTKPEAPAAPLELLATARQALSLPIVAIGGVTLNKAQTEITKRAERLSGHHRPL